MPHDSGRAWPPLMPWLLPSPSPPCLDLPGTPQGAAGEILSPWVPKEHILATPGPCLHFPAWVQGLMRTAVPSAPSTGSQPPRRCSVPALPSLNRGATARLGVAGSVPASQGGILPPRQPSFFPSSEGLWGDASHHRHQPHPATKGLACGYNRCRHNGSDGGKWAPLGLQGRVQGPGTGMAGTGTIGQGRWVSTQGKVSSSLGPFPESPAWQGPTSTTSKGRRC